jgi:microcystin-dependent protein
MPTGTSNTAVATTAFVQTNSIPTGSLMMWPTASAPSGYLLCNGTAVSRTTYAALFAIIGTTFGVGDNSTTFNLPNYTNRLPVGAGGLYAAAATGGSKDSVVVSHTHTATVTDSGHNHQTGSTSVESGFTQGGIRTTGTSGSVTSTSTTGISVGISTTGSSGTDANMPPYLSIFFIIKT